MSCRRPSAARPGTGSTARTRSRGSGSCAPCAISASTSRRSGACWSARSAWPTSPPRTRRRSTRRSACCGCRRPCSGRSPEEAQTPRRCSACTNWPNCPTTSASASSPTSSRRRSTAWTWSRASRSGCARRRLTLPDDPTPEQVDAWIELAELVQDPAFKASIRRMSEQHAAARAGGEEMQPDPDWQAAAAQVAERGGRRARRRRRRRARPRPTAIVGRAPAGVRARADRAALADQARDRHRRARRALLAAAGDHQRLAAGADHRPRVGVADRGPARVLARCTAWTPSKLRSWCLEQNGAIEDFPFGPNTSVFKVAGKMFAPEQARW